VAVSEENVEVVRSLYASWNAGDLDGLLAVMDPGIKIDYTGGAFPGVDEIYEGLEGARKYWEDLREPWQSLELEVEEVRASGDKVATVFTFEGKGREDIVVRRQLGNVITVTNGRVSRLDAYAEAAAALKAAGLSG
jgi:ketosteroid isomerase-like protein